MALRRRAARDVVTRARHKAQRAEAPQPDTVLSLDGKRLQTLALAARCTAHVGLDRATHTLRLTDLTISDPQQTDDLVAVLQWNPFFHTLRLERCACSTAALTRRLLAGLEAWGACRVKATPPTPTPLAASSSTAAAAAAVADSAVPTLFLNSCSFDVGLLRTVNPHKLRLRFGGSVPLAAEPASPCMQCGQAAGVYQCSRCQGGCYCSADCQLAHWSVHRTVCKPSAPPPASGQPPPQPPQPPPPRDLESDDAQDTQDTQEDSQQDTEPMPLQPLTPPSPAPPAAVADAPLAHVEVSRPPSGPPRVLVLLLHAAMGSEEATAAIGRRMGLPGRVLALRAPVKAPFQQAGQTWFRSFDRRGTLIEPQPGDARRADSLAQVCRPQLHQSIDALAAASGLDASRVYLVGFGQGGLAALDAALTHPTGVGGALGFDSGAVLAELASDLGAQGYTQRGARISLVHSKRATRPSAPALRTQLRELARLGVRITPSFTAEAAAAAIPHRAGLVFLYHELQAVLQALGP